MIRGILIDAEHQEIREVFVDDLEDYYNLINCNLVEVVHVGDVDIYCDEEGLYHPKGAFSYKGMPIVGNGIITGGVTKNGETISTFLQIDDVRKDVMWAELR